MRRVWVLLVLLLPAASAGEPLFAHSGDDGLFMNTDPDDERAEDGVASPEQTDDEAVWVFPLDPAATSIWDLDTRSNVTAHVGVGGTLGGVTYEVSWVLRSGPAIVAEGPARSVVGAGYHQLSWDVPTQAAAHDPRDGGLSWNVTATGTFAQIFLDVAGDDRSLVTLPIEERLPIRTEPPLEHEDLTGPRVEVDWEIPAPADRRLAYHWRPPQDFRVQADAAVDNGSISASLSDQAGEVRWQATWPGAGNGSVPFRNATGNWTLHLRFDAAVGTVSVVMEREIVQATTTSTTARRSPGIGVWAGLGLFAWALRRR